MKITLAFIRETEKARLYERQNGQQLWIPRSVIKTTLKHPRNSDGFQVHELDIEPWFARTKGMDQ